jgi:FemAB-related protein (PEP-CTERM system-associated)
VNDAGLRADEQSRPRGTGAAPLEIRELGAESAAWDAFVLAHPDGTFFHRAGWKRVVEESFGHKAPFLYVASGRDIRGVLPLVHIKSRLFGNGLSSTAFCVYGGPLAADDAARDALDAAATERMHGLGADYLEYRQLRRTHPDWPCKDQLYATFRRPIDPDNEKNLKAIPRKQRAVVRQSLQRGLTLVEDGVGDFFRIYSESVRNLGTPVFSERYFARLKAVFGTDCRITSVVHGGARVTSLVTFYFRDEVLPYYAGGTAAAREVGAFDFMYWMLIAEGAERGLRIFDFGRSKLGTGHFAFKKNWGFAPQPIYHEYQLRPGHEIPDVNPLNPKYRIFIAAWKRLPLAIANRIGPLIARDLG